jgi:hypothetical protein
MQSAMDEISSQRIEFIRIFQPHELAAGLIRGKHFQPAPGNLVRIPSLGLRMEEVGLESSLSLWYVTLQNRSDKHHVVPKGIKFGHLFTTDS